MDISEELLAKTFTANKQSRPATICLKLTIETLETDVYLLKVHKKNIGHWRRSGVFIVNFEHISHLARVSLLLTLSR